MERDKSSHRTPDVKNAVTEERGSRSEQTRPHGHRVLGVTGAMAKGRGSRSEQTQSRGQRAPWHDGRGDKSAHSRQPFSRRNLPTRAHLATTSQATEREDRMSPMTRASDPRAKRAAVHQSSSSCPDSDSNGGTTRQAEARPAVRGNLTVTVTEALRRSPQQRKPMQNARHGNLLRRRKSRMPR